MYASRRNVSVRSVCAKQGLGDLLGRRKVLRIARGRAECQPVASWGASHDELTNEAFMTNSLNWIELKYRMLPICYSPWCVVCLPTKFHYTLDGCSKQVSAQGILFSVDNFWLRLRVETMGWNWGCGRGGKWFVKFCWNWNKKLELWNRLFLILGLSEIQEKIKNI